MFIPLLLSITAQYFFGSGWLIIGSFLYFVALVQWTLTFDKHKKYWENLKISPSIVSTKHAVFLLCIITLLGGFLRFHQLESLPSKLWNDEIAHVENAKQIIEGNHAVFFASNNGRESLYIYLIAGAIQVLGESSFAIRFSGAIIGTLTIPLLYFLVARFFNREIAILSSLMLACNTWHIIMSRIAYRLILTIPVICISLIAFQKYMDTRSRTALLICSVSTGIGLYTYSTYRFVPLVILACWIVHILQSKKRERSSQWRDLFLFLLVCSVIALPLMKYAFKHQSDFNHRWKQISAFEQTNPIQTVIKCSLKTCYMVNYKGCFYKKYNLPDRPVLPGYISFMFPLGLLLCIRRCLKTKEMLILIAWLFGGLLPGMITYPAPWFSRPIIALPSILIITAIGFYPLFTLAKKSLTTTYNSMGFCILLLCMVFAWGTFAYQNIFDKWAAHIQPIKISGPIHEYHEPR